MTALTLQHSTREESSGKATDLDGLGRWQQYSETVKEVHPALRNDKPKDGGLHRRGPNYNPIGLKSPEIRSNSVRGPPASSPQSTFSDGRKAYPLSSTDEKPSQLKSILKNSNRLQDYSNKPSTKSSSKPANISVYDTIKTYGSSMNIRTNRAVNWPISNSLMGVSTGENATSTAASPGKSTSTGDNVSITSILPMEPYLAMTKKYSSQNHSSTFRLPGPVKTFVGGKEVSSVDNSKKEVPVASESKKDSGTPKSELPVYDIIVDDTIPLPESDKTKFCAPIEPPALKNIDLPSQPSSSAPDGESAAPRIDHPTPETQPKSLDDTNVDIIKDRSVAIGREKSSDENAQSQEPLISGGSHDLPEPYNQSIEQEKSKTPYISDDGTETDKHLGPTDNSEQQLQGLYSISSLSVPQTLRLKSADVVINVKIGDSRTESFRSQLASGHLEASIKKFCEDLNISSYLRIIREEIYSTIMSYTVHDAN